MIYESKSSDETFAIGVHFGKNALRGQVYCLKGQLGAGKTVFAKGFAKGLGEESHITSPSFSIMNVYEGGRLGFYHFDMYRIEEADEIINIGYEDYFYGNGVCLIEWPEMVKESIPKDAIFINIERNYEKDENYRKITVEYTR